LAELVYIFHYYNKDPRAVILFNEAAETPSENETKRSRTDAKEKASSPKESALKELFKAFTRGVYYADKE